MSGPLTKGALVAYLPTAATSKPIVTAFQFNPEKMVHTWSQAAPAGQPGVEAGNPLAVAGMPGETFQLTILLDADDDVTGPAALARPRGITACPAAWRHWRYCCTRSPAPGLRRPRRRRGAVPRWPRRAQAAAGWHRPVSRLTAWSARCPRRRVPEGHGSHVGGAEFNGADRLVRLGVETGAAGARHDVDDHRDAVRRAAQPDSCGGRHRAAGADPAELFAARPDAGTPAETAQTAYQQMLDRRRQWAATDAANAPASIIGMLPQ